MIRSFSSSLCNSAAWYFHFKYGFMILSDPVEPFADLRNNKHVEFLLPQQQEVLSMVIPAVAQKKTK